MSVESDRIHGINLAQGVCDTEVPAPVAEAAIAAIRNGQNIYTRAEGIWRAADRNRAKARHYNHIECDPDSGVLVTSRRHRRLLRRLHGAV